MDSRFNKSNEEYDVSQSWNIIESYFEGQHLGRLVRHQLESYNNFVSKQIQSTIMMFNPVEIKSEHYKDEKTDVYVYDRFIAISYSKGNKTYIFTPNAVSDEGSEKSKENEDDDCLMCGS